MHPLPPHMATGVEVKPVIVPMVMFFHLHLCQIAKFCNGTLKDSVLPLHLGSSNRQVIYQRSQCPQQVAAGGSPNRYAQVEPFGCSVHCLEGSVPTFDICHVVTIDQENSIPIVQYL